MQKGDLNWDLLEHLRVLVEGLLGPIRHCGMGTGPLEPQDPVDRNPLVKEGLILDRLKLLTPSIGG